MRAEDALYGIEDVERLPTERVLGPRIDAIKSGEWSNFDWPYPMLTELAMSLLPGTCTMIIGSSGSTKSFLTLGTNYWWHAMQLIDVAVMELEDPIENHLMRLLAILSGRWEVLKPKWGREHPELLQEIYDEHAEYIDSFASRISAKPLGRLTFQRLTQWIQTQLDSGVKIITVDPVTAVGTGERRDIEDKDFIENAMEMIRKYDARLILVSHPKVSSQPPSKSNIAGGAAYDRHTQCILWITSGEKRVTLKKEIGVERITCNRIVHILKSRNGSGEGKRIAFHLNSQVQFNELGLIQSVAKFKEGDDEKPTEMEKVEADLFNGGAVK